MDINPPVVQPANLRRYSETQTVVTINPKPRSLKELFLKQQNRERHPSHKNIQKELELEYLDEDHTVAHGVHRRSLRRSRSTSCLLTSGAKTATNLPPEDTIMRRRRGSLDDRTPGKPRKLLVDVEETQRLILHQEDTDGDFQITVFDKGPKSFPVGTANSNGFKKYEIRGTYMLSNLLQELAIAADYGRRLIVINEDRLSENPVDRLSRLIKYHFWDSLTRRIDADGLEAICADSKNRGPDQRNRVFVPYHDQLALEYYAQVAKDRPHLRLDVVRLPEIITPQYVKTLNHHPGILSLGLRETTDHATHKKTIRGTPFVVPGGRFNEMYGWDSYFEALGLLVDGRTELARGMVENFCYEIEHYGKILNANRSYYLTRSQPPFLTDMIIQVYAALSNKPEWGPARRQSWMHNGIRASIKELFSVWLAPPRLDEATGLVKYHPEGIGMPPETESSHFDHILAPYCKKHGLDPDVPEDMEHIKRMYSSGHIKEPELDEYFIHDRAVRESGHDTTYRFEGRCASLATIDLNSLLYKYETDLYDLIAKHCGGSFTVKVRRGPEDAYLNGLKVWVMLLKTEGIDSMLGGDEGNVWNTRWAKGIMVYDNDESSSSTPTSTPTSTTNGSRSAGVKHKPSFGDRFTEINSFTPKIKTIKGADYVELTIPAQLFRQLAQRTQHQVHKYLWNPKEKMFFDWDCKRGEQSTYETCTTLWALWSGLATAQQAKQMVPVALSHFEVTGGLVSGTELSRGAIGLSRPNRQWDFPFGWAPHQMIAWEGLKNYGFMPEARRIAYRWLYTITKSFVDFNGVVPEKFDIVNMTHKVNVEYGNVGADFKFVVREGFGWMNASYQVGQTYLTKNMRRALGALIPPQELFDRSGEAVKSHPSVWKQRNSFDSLERVLSHYQEPTSNNNCVLQ